MQTNYVFSALYRSPSQSQSELTIFTATLDLTLQAIASKHPSLILVLGDFNVKNKVLFDQDKTTIEGTIINDLMIQYDLINNSRTYSLTWLLIFLY